MLGDAVEDAKLWESVLHETDNALGRSCGDFVGGEAVAVAVRLDDGVGVLVDQHVFDTHAFISFLLSMGARGRGLLHVLAAHVVLRQQEQRGALVHALHDLASGHHLGQEGAGLLAADAQLGGHVAALHALQGVGQEVLDLGLDLGVLALGLGRLVALAGVALHQLLLEGGQLVLDLGGQVGGQSGIDGVDVGNVLHVINPFWFQRLSLPFVYSLQHVRAVMSS